MNASVSACLHCGQPTAKRADFCCSGCETAYRMINDMGLGGYYDRRILTPEAPSLRPDNAENDPATPVDISGFAISRDENTYILHLMVEGLHCASCVWLIENVLMRQPGVLQARVNMSTRRLVLQWQGDKTYGNDLVAILRRLGYRLMPYDPTIMESTDEAERAFLLRCMGVAGFAAGNIMLISVSLWADTAGSMGQGTIDLFHWLSALIGLCAIVYCGRPFFRSALQAVRSGHGNMDVPISIALILTGGISLYETITHGDHIYFESATMLVFFLLAGRYLDARARGSARAAAHDLLKLVSGSATIVQNGHPRILPIRDLQPDMVLLVPAGARLAADGRVIEGESDIDASLITGETLPCSVSPGSHVFAGTLNLGAPLKIRITGAQENTLLADIVRLMEAAEQSQARYVRIADRAARLYTPIVHTLGALTFAGWWLLAGLAWQDALMIGITVLIITCPCALGLAVPVVQVLAAGRLMKRGIYLKSGDALERLATINTVVFDKTGTLTRGKPELVNRTDIDDHDLSLAAALAVHSAHPLSRALVRAAGQCPIADLQVDEHPGNGLQATVGGRLVKLGRAEWCGIDNPPQKDMSFWLHVGGRPPVCFRFADTLRPDAAETIKQLKQDGLDIVLLSGDREPAVSTIAHQAGIKDARANLRPADKCAALEKMAEAGKRVLMVGDGLNDAPALAASYVSMSPSSAMDITQNTADIVFQGEQLSPVLTSWKTARMANRLTRQNLAMAVIYNVLAIPLAIAGFVTPLIAALAMSGSSLLVVVNALRLRETYNS